MKRPVNPFSMGLILVLAVLLTGCPAAPPAPESKSPVPEGRQRPRPKAGTAETRRWNPDGTLRHWKGGNLSGPLEADARFRRLQRRDAHKKIALEFLDRFRSDLGLKHPSRELVVTEVKVDGLGMAHVRLRQVFRNIPVQRGEIRVHLDRNNRVVRVQGRYIPTPTGIDPRPSIDLKAAEKRVARDLGRSGCPRCRGELVIRSDPSHPPRLAYRVVTRPGLARGWVYFIDARDGSVLDRYSNIKTRRSPPGSPK